ncbi:MAG TPA: ADP-ribosylation factor-like protein [Geobacteraceae bacterium]
MALVNHVKKEINAKLVYFGPTGAGKATTLNAIYKRLKADFRSKIKSMAIQNDRMLFFDFAAPGQQQLDSYSIRFHLYTVVGPSFSPSPWKIVLKGVDGVVFVADSGAEQMAVNSESLSHLEECLRVHGASLAEVTCVIQYNNRDLPDALSVADLEDSLNQQGFPSISSTAARGEGVLDALSLLVRKVMANLKEDGLVVEGSPEQFAPAAARPVEQPLEDAESTGWEAELESTPATPRSEEAVEEERRIEASEPTVGFAGEAQLLDTGALRIPLAVRHGNTTKTVILTLTLSEV